MIIVITRNGKCAGISTVVGSIDTRILTRTAEAALCEDLKELSSGTNQIGAGMVSYNIEISDDDGSRHSFTAAHDPNNPWCDPIKRILNETGMVDRS